MIGEELNAPRSRALSENWALSEKPAPETDQVLSGIECREDRNRTVELAEHLDDAVHLLVDLIHAEPVAADADVFAIELAFSEGF